MGGAIALFIVLNIVVLLFNCYFTHQTWEVTQNAQRLVGGYRGAVQSLSHQVASRQ